MGAPTLHEPVAPPFRRTARLIGAFSAASGLVLASVTAQSLTLITRRDLRGGLALLAGVLLLRWLIALWGEQWAERCAQLQRDYLRAHLLGHFFRPRSANEGGRGDLVTAIERVAQLPLLTSLESSARVALLGIGVVIWAAGWLSGAIVMVRFAPLPPMTMFAFGIKFGLDELLLITSEETVVSTSPIVKFKGPTVPLRLIV